MGSINLPQDTVTLHDKYIDCNVSLQDKSDYPQRKGEYRITIAVKKNMIPNGLIENSLFSFGFNPFIESGTLTRYEYFMHLNFLECIDQGKMVNEVNKYIDPANINGNLIRIYRGLAPKKIFGPFYTDPDLSFTMTTREEDNYWSKTFGKRF